MNHIDIIGEIGNNHNGSLENAKKLIDFARMSGFDYVKFQKRTPHLCVPEHQKELMKETPWGKMSYLEYREMMEFNKNDYDEIDMYCKEIGMKWFASVWDIPSVDFMAQYTDVMKIPSALLTNDELVKYARSKSKILMVSTGMSTEDEIFHAVMSHGPDVLFHTNSAYPSPIEDLNLGYIRWLHKLYPLKQIGYSGHDYGLTTTFAVVPMGVKWIERHITIDRNMWGSDQQSSVEPAGMYKLVRGIRDIEKAISKGFGPREVFTSELSKKQSLRG